MEVYVADVFDYTCEMPFVVGVYDTEEKAWDAIRIVLDRVVEKNPKTNVEARFVCYVTPVQLNGFTPACMDQCFAG